MTSFCARTSWVNSHLLETKYCLGERNNTGHSIALRLHNHSVTGGLVWWAENRIAAQQRTDKTFWDARNLYHFYFSTNNEDVRGIFLKQDTSQTAKWCLILMALKPMSLGRLPGSFLLPSPPELSCLLSLRLPLSVEPLSRGRGEGILKHKDGGLTAECSKTTKPILERKEKKSIMDSNCKCFQISVNISKHLY